MAEDTEAARALRREGHGIVALLCDAVDKPTDEAKQAMVEAARRLVDVRDRLIAAQRSGARCDGDLAEVNAVLSSVVSVEFPLGGFRREAIRTACSSLQRLLDR